MTRSFKSWATTLVLVTPLLTSCAELADGISAPTGERDHAEIEGLVAFPTDAMAPVAGLLWGGTDADAPEVWKWIGPEGGTLSTGAYTIIVPEGAVSDSVWFGIEPSNNGSYSLELYAESKAGEHSYDHPVEFIKPITFEIKYEGAINVTDPTKLSMVYVPPKGGSELQATSIDSLAKTARCQMRRFAKYALVQN
jgi:hypothetical protein